MDVHINNIVIKNIPKYVKTGDYVVSVLYNNEHWFFGAWYTYKDAYQVSKCVNGIVTKYIV